VGSPRIQAIEKGSILREIDRLKNLDNHHRRINEIIHGDVHSKKQQRGIGRLGSLDQIEKVKSMKLSTKSSQYRKERKPLFSGHYL
jgi:hypothetical protein